METPTGNTEDARRNRRKDVIKDFALIIALIVACIIGIGMGLGLKEVSGWTKDDKRKIFYLKFPGQLLLNMLKLLILPLVVSSLITATATLDKKASGRLGLGAIIYYMTTTLIAVIIGIVLVLSIHPGDPEDLNKLTRSGSSKNTKPLDALLDLIRNCFPDNLVTMCFEREITEVDQHRVIKTVNETVVANYTVDDPKLVAGSGMNVLGIVVISLALGCVINHLKEAGKPLLMFFESLNEAIMILIKLVIWYSPIGIMFLLAAKFVETDDIGEIASRLGMYMLTVLAGLAIHAVIVLPLIYFIATRKNPGSFFVGMLKALCTAFGTASSSATLPVTMECLTDNNGVDERVVRFVAPIGATINMDGTALYEAVASIFIAQINGITLSVANVIVVSLTATAAAIGAAGVPQAGLVTMVIVLTAVDLPTEDVTLILAIDWFLDRFRTAVNVWGDSIGAGTLNHIFRNMFASLDHRLVEQEIDVGEDSSSSADRKNEKSGKVGNGTPNLGYEPDNATKDDTRL
ncbi:hypothetical protein BaRGS_00019300 [Batillaria attramentaria]|uniref:Amino acid transporter n=1 Tax=Batillaria attramentaria TaxID=370345 RepID=A0ABD0KRB8_9CAEN